MAAGGYLLSQMGGHAGEVVQQASQATSSWSGSASRSTAPRSSLLGSAREGEMRLLRSRRAPQPSGVEAPFSKDWRERATPDLTSRSPSFGRSFQGGGEGVSPDRSGEVVASRRPSLGVEGRHAWGGRASAGSGSIGSGWRKEARQFSGRAQALSSQLRSMSRSSSEISRSETSAPEKAKRSGRSSAEARTDDRDVPPPPSVPIDDHVRWLAVAGLLWGVWRLWG